MTQWFNNLIPQTAIRAGFSISLVIVLALLLANLSHRDEGVIAGACFEGRVPGLGSIQLTPARDGADSIQIEIPEADYVASLTETKPAGMLRWIVTPRRSDETNGFITLKTPITATNVTAVWEGVGTPTASFELRQFAELSVLRRKRGWAFGEFGSARVFEARLPVLLEHQPWHESMNSLLRAHDVAAAKEFCSMSWAEAWDSVRQPSHGNRWASEISRHIVHHNSRVCSVLEQVYEYTGGAHGNVFLRGWNFLAEGHEARALNLPQLFRDGTPWKERLADLCKADLRRQGASMFTAGGGGIEPEAKLEQGDLTVITLSPAGLRIHFAPYEVGSWAEGTYSVLLPYATIEPLLAIEVVKHFRN
ncbi:MAG: DUF3298 domain-containing protein [Pedosphaera sp.]|nr:DUF3298 domain-containing protein [Pedosphaera sp.]